MTEKQIRKLDRAGSGLAAAGFIADDSCKELWREADAAQEITETWISTQAVERCIKTQSSQLKTVLSD